MSKEKLVDLLTTELIEQNITHENPPPGHSCIEECGITAEDYIAASNPVFAPMRSDGMKHKKCMDCWNEYISGLADRIINALKE